MYNKKDFLVELRKHELLSEIIKIGYHNFFHRALYLCDDIDSKDKIKPIIEEYIYLNNLENGKITNN